MAFNVPRLDALREWLISVRRLNQNFGPTDFSAEPPLRLPNGTLIPHFHYGIDFTVPSTPGGGAPEVLSFSSGRVIAAGPSGNGFGNYIKILSPNGYTYTYAHLHDWFGQQFGQTIAPHNLRVGDLVHAGDIIGHQGSTGNSTGPHVHFQINAPNGQPVDPGRSIDAVFYTVYHALGFGGGYLPTQSSTIPDPVRPIYEPVPDILPTNPDISGPGDVRFYLDLGRAVANRFNVPIPEGDPTGGTGTGYQYDPIVSGGTSTGGIFSGPFFSFLTTGGGIIGNVLNPTQAEDATPADPQNIVLFIGAVLLGVIFLWGGISQLNKSGPVAIVTQPVIQSVDATKNAAGKIAAIAA